MSQTKKKIRSDFRQAVFARDGHCCRICGWKPVDGDYGLDAHHIVDRHNFANGGYVKENGISLCNNLARADNCHEKAEIFHQTGEGLEGYKPEQLFALIGSSFEKAVVADAKLT